MNTHDYVENLPKIRLTRTYITQVRDHDPPLTESAATSELMRTLSAGHAGHGSTNHTHSREIILKREWLPKRQL